MSVRFLDTNVLIRLLTRDDEDKARRALALLSRIERGEEAVAISPLVVFETVYTLQRSYKVPRQQIRDTVVDILSLAGLRLPNKSLYRQTLDLYAASGLPFGDAYNAVYLQRHKLDGIYSWDTDYDRLEGIERVEP